MRRKQQKRRRNFFTPQKTILLVILLCFIIVICLSIFSFLYKPEDHIKGTIENLSRDYYENYLYPSFNEINDFENDPSVVMKKYEKHGFPTLSLRKLLLYDNRKNGKYADELTHYCDEDHTIIRFYPEAPYEKDNYRIDFTYSCEF